MIDLDEAKEAFEVAAEAESENRRAALDDLRFARLDDQWPEEIARKRAGRPMLTVNKMKPFIRQVTNDARMNRPSNKVRPVDSDADVRTARVMGDLIRHIEQQSNADIAYDTACDFAVTMGWGYWTVDIDYAYDDTFDQDIFIKRVANPFAIYGDPRSVEADSSDWMEAFETELMSRDDFEATWPDAAPSDWSGSEYAELSQPWMDGDDVLVAKYWKRSKIMRPLLKLSNGLIVRGDSFEANRDVWEQAGVSVVAERQVRSYKVVRAVLTGADVLEEADWVGTYIPIVPVYGDEVNVEGKRYLQSLIRSAKDAQRQYNYWRTAATELVALAPKTPFIGPEEAFEGRDALKWETANEENHSYISFKGGIPPQRQGFAGVPGGAIQEALSANDDMKAIIGIYDASLGARSNETSGRAIMARQREGDVSTFHFIDNLNRAIRHTGKILIDLIPKVYTGDRVLRVIGQDGSVDAIPLGAPVPVKGADGKPEIGEDGQPVMHIYDLSVGKYDVVSEAGPSYTTRRQEAAEQMIELLRAFPVAAEVVGDLFAKNLDWPGADEIAERLKKLYEAKFGRSDNAEVQKLTQALQQATERIRELEGDRQVDMAGLAIKRQEVGIKQYAAETDRMEVRADAILQQNAQRQTASMPQQNR